MGRPVRQTLVVATSARSTRRPLRQTLAVATTARSTRAEPATGGQQAGSYTRMNSRYAGRGLHAHGVRRCDFQAAPNDAADVRAVGPTGVPQAQSRLPATSTQLRRGRRRGANGIPRARSSTDNGTCGVCEVDYALGAAGRSDQRGRFHRVQDGSPDEQLPHTSRRIQNDGGLGGSPLIRASLPARLARNECRRAGRQPAS